VTHADRHEDQQGEVAIGPLVPDWSAAAAVPATIANVFVAQLGAPAENGRIDGVYLVTGHAAPPIVLGTPERMVEILQGMQGQLSVDVSAKLFLPRDRVAELVALLQDALSKLDAREAARSAE